MKHSNKTITRKGNPSFLVADNRRDALTPFRWFTNRVRARPHKGETDLTEEFLKALWEKQDGVCPLTGWKMLLPDSTRGHATLSEFSPANASLDRIDNGKGYIQNNVRFVSVIANFARSRWSDKILINFCCDVASRYTYGINK